MSLSLIQSIWTVVVAILFLGIVLWSYSGRRKNAFDEAARLPLEDEIAKRPDSSIEE